MSTQADEYPQLTALQEEGINDMIHHWPWWSDHQRRMVMRGVIWANRVHGMKTGCIAGIAMGIVLGWAFL